MDRFEVGFLLCLLCALAAVVLIGLRLRPQPVPAWSGEPFSGYISDGKGHPGNKLTPNRCSDEVYISGIPKPIMRRLWERRTNGKCYAEDAPTLRMSLLPNDEAR